MYVRHGGIVGGMVSSGLAGIAYATPSGLNNIPTADPTRQGAFVPQAFGTVGGEADNDFNPGFKTEIDFGRWTWSSGRIPLFHRAMPVPLRSRRSSCFPWMTSCQRLQRG